MSITALSAKMTETELAALDEAHLAEIEAWVARVTQSVYHLADVTRSQCLEYVTWCAQYARARTVATGCVTHVEAARLKATNTRLQAERDDALARVHKMTQKQYRVDKSGTV